MNDISKLWLIVKREYLVRVRKTTFILATILTPLGIGLIAFVSGYLASSSMTGQKKIALVDEARLLDTESLSSSQYLYTHMDQSAERLKDEYFKSVKVYPQALDLEEKNIIIKKIKDK